MLLCSVLTSPTVAFAGGSAGGWSFIKSDSECHARMLRPPPRPYLIIDVRRADAATTITMMGLPLPKDYQPGWRDFEADVTVKLNGRAVLTTKGKKSERYFGLERIAFKALQAMTDPGPMMFEFKGTGGRGEIVEFDSPGLGPGIASLKACLGGR
ncbi:MAG: hypothetical protein AB7E80_16045 [Hyphomicrobiaceae bacterium]